MSEFLAQPRYEDARFFLRPPKSNSNDPAMSAWQGGIYMPEFSDGALIKELHGGIQLPHGYKEGSDIVLHIHWGHKNAGADANIVWQIEWVWSNFNGSMASTTTSTATVACTSTAANKHLITDVVTPSGTGKTVSSLVLCRIFRDPGHASDNYGSSIWFLDADAHVILDTIGSNSLTTKA